jgi:hypothetical protein
MKSVTVAVYLLVALLGLHALPVSCFAANWTLIDENDSSSFYYDKSSITKPEVGKVRVTTRALYTPEGKADALKVLAHYKDMDKLDESRYVYDFDCLEEQSHLLDVTHLDKEGRILRSSNLGGATSWEDILPETRLAYVFDEVCPK